MGRGRGRKCCVVGKARLTARIEDYGLIGDTHSCGLVGIDGSIDWLCLPRFDSGSVFARILDPSGGHWRVSPADEAATSRHYRSESMVLETTFETARGVVTLTDCLPLEERCEPRLPRSITPEDVIARVVKGKRGAVRMEMEYAPRFDYGHVVPWFSVTDEDVVIAIGGPDALDLRASVELDVDRGTVRASFDVKEGEAVQFVAGYRESHSASIGERHPDDCEALIEATDRFWREWAAQCRYDGRWREAVIRSLLTLKAFTYSPTGGIVAAATTSLPEAIGGERNWDYRYCWLRDATFMLESMMEHGFMSEAAEWRDWLVRAVAGDPEDLQIMYGVRGERRLLEYELDWLAGYEGSRPVRVGNAAVDQFQLDVYGEVMDALHAARRAGLEVSGEAWAIQKSLVDHVLDHWREPDDGIWEVRSGPRHFVHSKVMAWVAIDRAIVAVERYGLEGPVDRWKDARAEIREQVLERGVDADTGRFKRAYDDPELDASLLMLPLVGFIDATDTRMQATIEAIENELTKDGLVRRYRTEVAEDGLPPGEGSFLMCSFWLADCLVLLGRGSDAEKLFERLLTLRNDLGLLSEQYDSKLHRLVGNFPQSFSHTALVATAATLVTGGNTSIVDRRR
jgi:GH15 family glucan-1,4-alpha-glucosidase